VCARVDGGGCFACCMGSLSRLARSVGRSQCGSLGLGRPVLLGSAAMMGLAVALRCVACPECKAKTAVLYPPRRKRGFRGPTVTLTRARQSQIRASTVISCRKD
jgi:hypothetical protein